MNEPTPTPKPARFQIFNSDLDPIQMVVLRDTRTERDYPAQTVTGAKSMAFILATHADEDELLADLYAWSPAEFDGYAAGHLIQSLDQ